MPNSLPPDSMRHSASTAGLFVYSLLSHSYNNEATALFNPWSSFSLYSSSPMENSYKKSLVSASTTLQDNVNNSSMDLPGIGTPVNVPLTRQISKREDSPPESESHTRSVTPVQHHINPKALEAGFSKGKEQLMKCERLFVRYSWLCIVCCIPSILLNIRLFTFSSSRKF